VEGFVYAYTDDDEEIDVPPSKISWQPFIGIAAHWVANVCVASADAWRAVAQEMFSDANYHEELEMFRRDASIEIETLASLHPALDDDEDEDDE
jgi:hypothetical protein